MSGDRNGRDSSMQARRDAPKDQRGDTPPLLSPQLRAALRRDLTPTSQDRARVRAGVWSAVAGGVLPPSAARVDAVLGVKSLGLKAGAAAAGHTLATKLIVSAFLVAGALGAVGTSLAPAPAPRRDAPAAPVAAAPTPIPQDVAAATTTTTTPTADELMTPVPAQAQRPSATPLARRAIQGATHLPRNERSARPARTSSQETSTTNDPPQPALAALVVAQAAGDSQAAPPPTAASITPGTSPEQPRPSLGAELAIVRAASTALDHHQPKDALGLLLRYEAAYPRGALRVEAEALRVMALCSTREASAASASASFLREHTESALAERVRRACAAAH